MKLLADQRGVTALEFTLIATVLFALLLAVASFGDVIQKEIALQEAVRAGGEYARNHFTPVGKTPIAESIASAVTSALPTGSQTPTVTLACSCNNGALGSTCDGIAAGTTSCSSPLLVKLTATMPTALQINAIVWSGSIPYGASYEVRVK